MSNKRWHVTADPTVVARRGQLDASGGFRTLVPGTLALAYGFNNGDVAMIVEPAILIHFFRGWLSR
jgi:hypothetical protein